MVHTMRALAVLLGMFPAFLATGQNDAYALAWAEGLNNARFPASGLIGRDTSGFYVYRQHKPDADYFWLEHYRYPDYQQEFAVEIALPTIGKRSAQLEKILLLDEHFLLFTSFYDRNSDQNRAFASLLDKEGNVVKSIFEVDRIDNVTNRKNTGHFAFQLSPDSAYVLAFHNTPYSESENARFSVKLLDKRLNELWKKKFKMPYADQDFEVVTALVGNDQSVYMVCRLFGQGVLSASEMNANKKYTLFHYNHVGRKLTEYEINVDDNWIHSARFELVNDTTLVSGGFFSSSGQGNIAGAFQVRFNTKSGELINHGFADLPRDVMLDVGYNDDLLFGGLASFEMRRMMPRTDGSIVLVAEKSYVSTSTFFDPYTGQRLVNYYYHDDDVIVVSLSPGGQVEWARTLAKNQTSTDSDEAYTSIAVNLYRDDVFILFNDHPANLNFVREPGEVKTASNFNKSVPVLAHLDRGGRMLVKPLMRDTEPEVILIPRFSKEWNSSRQLIYGVLGGKDKFGEIFYRPD